MSEKFKNVLFVGGLNSEIGLIDLRSYFSEFGTIAKISIPGGKNSKGYAFIKFEENECMLAVLKNQHTIKGRKVNCTQALPPKEARKQTSKKIKKKIFVGGLSPKTTEKDLSDYFTKFGEVTNAYLIWNERNKKSMQFGFVEFETEEAADAAQICNSHLINGRTCFSKFQIDPTAKPNSKFTAIVEVQTKSPSSKCCNSNEESEGEAENPLTKNWIPSMPIPAETEIFYQNSAPESPQNYCDQPAYYQHPDPVTPQNYCNQQAYYPNHDYSQNYYSYEASPQTYYPAQDCYGYNEYCYDSDPYYQGYQDQYTTSAQNPGYYETQYAQANPQYYVNTTEVMYDYYVSASYNQPQYM